MNCLRTRQIRRVLVPVMAVSLLSACTGWKVQEMAPAQVVADKWPSKVRLTMLDGDRMELADPMISNGEIVGHPFRNVGGHKWVIRSDTLRLATDSVAHIEIRAADSFKTGIAVTVGILFAGAVAGAIAISIALNNW